MKKIYKVSEATDIDGRRPFKTICFIGAKNKDEARKLGNKSGFHIENCGFFKIEELTKEDAKEIKKQAVLDWEIADYIYSGMSHYFEDTDNKDFDEAMKIVIKRAKKEFKRSVKVLELIDPKFF